MWLVIFCTNWLLLLPANISLVFIMSSFLVKRYKLQTKPRPVRYIVYTMVALLALSSYVAMTVSHNSRAPSVPLSTPWWPYWP